MNFFCLRPEFRVAVNIVMPATGFLRFAVVVDFAGTEVIRICSFVIKRRSSTFTVYVKVEYLFVSSICGAAAELTYV